MRKAHNGGGHIDGGPANAGGGRDIGDVTGVASGVGNYPAGRIHDLADLVGAVKSDAGSSNSQKFYMLISAFGKLSP